MKVSICIYFVNYIKQLNNKKNQQKTHNVMKTKLPKLKQFEVKLVTKLYKIS